MGHSRVRIGKTEEGRTVLEVLQAQGEYIPAPCGGNGSCGKCRVRLLGTAPAPSQTEQSFLTEQELSDGIRLACLTDAFEGMEVEILPENEKDMEVETAFSLGSIGTYSARIGIGIGTGTGASSAPGTVQPGTGASSPASAAPGSLQANDSAKDSSGDSMKDSSKDSSKDSTEDSIAAAVDIGTTTIALSAVNTGSKEILGTATGINHQRAWGADVISRMEASNQGKGEQLRKSILEDLEHLLAELGLSADTPMVISGNTTMEHLLQGYSCRTLGVAPYKPVDISLHEYENMTILPGISTFVGADIVSGIVACGMDRSEEICILVDLGTNGEMAIGNRDRIISASTAAGPAFEGGNISCGVAGIPGAVRSVEITDGKAVTQTIGNLPPAGLCGTGVLETIYELLKEELVDETGLLDDEYFEEGFPIADGIVFTAKDVREVQLAKSAVRAGLEVLLQEYGVEYDRIGKLYIAGGFGQKINLEKAVGIGLLPEELLDRMIPVGNSSLAGAVMAACDPEILERMRAVGEKAEETSLAENPLFSELYMDHMFFPEQE